MRLFHIQRHLFSLYEFTQCPFARRFLQFSVIVEMIEKRSIQHRSLQTALGPSPQILLKQGLIDAQEFHFLLRFPVEASKVSPVSFLSPHAWGAIKVQSRLLTCDIKC